MTAMMDYLRSSVTRAEARVKYAKLELEGFIKGEIGGQHFWW
jgi:hypothetical protein